LWLDVAEDRRAEHSIRAAEASADSRAIAELRHAFSLVAVAIGVIKDWVS
jgi:hypothetical protein